MRVRIGSSLGFLPERGKQCHKTPALSCYTLSAVMMPSFMLSRSCRMIRFQYFSSGIDSNAVFCCIKYRKLQVKMSDSQKRPEVFRNLNFPKSVPAEMSIFLCLILYSIILVNFEQNILIKLYAILEIRYVINRKIKQ